MTTERDEIKELFAELIKAIRAERDALDLSHTSPAQVFSVVLDTLNICQMRYLEAMRDTEPPQKEHLSKLSQEAIKASALSEPSAKDKWNSYHDALLRVAKEF